MRIPLVESFLRNPTDQYKTKLEVDMAMEKRVNSLALSGACAVGFVGWGILMALDWESITHNYNCWSPLPLAVLASLSVHYFRKSRGLG
jgi:hypothetical protein